MPTRHATDEELIAKLDGELGLIAGARVHSHIQICWQCRVRMRELEDQALRVAKAAAGDRFPGPERVALATRRFIAWQTQRRIAESEPSRRLFVPRAPAWSAAAVVLATLAAVTLHRPHPVPGTMPVEQGQTIAIAAERAEQMWGSGVCHQKLAIRMTSRTSQNPVVDHLELWSDRDQSRFAVEWRDQAGRLQAATWKPSRHAAYRLYPNTHELVSGPVTQQETQQESSLVTVTSFQLTGSDRDILRFEEELIRYFTGRLKPISLSRDFVKFAGSDGLVVRVESAPLPGGVYRLAASRQRNGITAELVLEIDAKTFNTTSLRLTLRRGTQRIEVLIATEQMERPERAQLSVVTFEPKLSEISPAKANGSVSIVSASPSGQTAAVQLQDLNQKEIDIYYALHRIAACLSGPIRVDRLASGKFVVSGLVEKQEKESVASILRNFSGVEAHLTTFAEALQQHSAPTFSSRPSASVRLEVDNSFFPSRNRLETYLTRDGAISLVSLSNRAISLSASGLAEAWAIRRLRERFPLGYPDPLGLIDQMLSDHRKAFRGRISELRTVLKPLLISPDIFPSGTPSLLDAAQSIDRLVRSMFSSQTPEASLDSTLQQLSGWLSTTDRNDFVEREP